MYFWYNAGSFQLDKFGDSRITKESKITRIQIDSDKPSWINTQVVSNLIADETQLIQFGVAEEDEFTTIEFGPPAPSSMTSWPTPEEPDNYYKISSSWVTLRMD